MTGQLSQNCMRILQQTHRNFQHYLGISWLHIVLNGMAKLDMDRKKPIYNILVMDRCVIPYTISSDSFRLIILIQNKTGLCTLTTGDHENLCHTRDIVTCTYETLPEFTTRVRGEKGLVLGSFIELTKVCSTVHQQFSSRVLKERVERGLKACIGKR